MLLRLCNDAEENPGPTLYDIVDVTKTVCADFSQGCQIRFGQSAGKQCVAMSLTAMVYNQIQDVSTWDSSFLNTILVKYEKMRVLSVKRKGCLENGNMTRKDEQMKPLSVERKG